MRRATFLTTLFGSLILIVTLQVFTMTSSPGFQDDGALHKGGRYSAVIPLAPPRVGLPSAPEALLMEQTDVKPLEATAANAHRLSTPVASFGIQNLSRASIALAGRVVQRREDIDRRQRENNERISPQSRWSRYIKGVAKKVVGVNIVEDGRVEPSEEVAESSRLRTVFHHITDPDDLLQRFRYMDIVYTWVNGSEYNHMFRKYYRRHAIKKTFIPMDPQEDRPPTATTETGRILSPEESAVLVRRRQNGGKLPLLPPTDDGASPPINRTLMHEQKMRWVPVEPNRHLGSLRDLHSFLDANRIRFISSRDRESDELRFSMRSLDQYVDWHHGRIIIVSPGQCPLWLDHASNFFARSQRILGHARRRVVAVHQDAIIPGNQRLTFNTNGIEQHIYKLKNLSDLFVQFNDDYFVNHATTVGDFVNKYGGPALLHEGGEVKGAALAHRQIKKIWLGGVYNTNSFIIRELEEVSPSYIPRYVAAKVQLRKIKIKVVRPVQLHATVKAGDGVEPREHSVAIAAGGEEVAHQVSPNESAAPPPPPPLSSARQLFEAQVSQQRRRVPGRPIARVVDEHGREIHEQQSKRKRYFLKHAPFVYCRRMFEHLAERYEREFTEPAVSHPHRHKADLLMPFVHNAFVMDRPWVASPNYLPHMLALADSGSREAMEPLTIHLDNEDGCAPAVTKIGEAAKSLLVIFVDDIKENERRIERLADVNPVFFALNDGFSRPEAAMQLRSFMLSKYPDRSVFEAPPTLPSREDPPSNADLLEAAHTAPITESFMELMALPLVIMVNDNEANFACPFLRSLRLGLPRHIGRVVIVEDRRHSDVPLDDKDVLRDDAPRLLTRCVWDPDRVEVWTGDDLRSSDDEHLEDPRRIIERILQRGTPSTFRNNSASVRRKTIDTIPAHYGEGVDGITGFVFDLRRTLRGGPFFASAVAQTLALEDFVLLPPLGAGGDNRSWLYASPSDARHRLARDVELSAGTDVLYWPINWVQGTSPDHLLNSFPLPHATYEAVEKIKYTFNGDDSW